MITLHVNIRSELGAFGDESGSAWTEEVKRELYQRAQNVVPRFEEALRDTWNQRALPLTGRMRDSLGAVVTMEGTEAAEEPWLEWGYFPENVAEAGRADDLVDALQNYISAEELGYSGQSLPPYSRIAHWVQQRLGEGNHRFTQYVRRKLAREGLVGLGIVQGAGSFRTMPQYQQLLQSTIDGVGLAAMRRVAARLGTVRGEQVGVVPTTFARGGRQVAQFRVAAGVRRGGQFARVI